MISKAVNASVLRKLEELRAEYERLGAEMNRPEVAGDSTRIVTLTRAHGRLRSVIEPYDRYRTLVRDLENSRSLLDDPAAEEDLKALAADEVAALEPQADTLMDELCRLLVTSDDAAVNSIILEIRAGTGGQEAALFARDLHAMYVRYCDRRGFTVETLDASASEMGGFKEIVLNIRGEGVYQRLGYEGGGHRVQRVPVTEAQGRIHTSAATVAVLPEPDQVEVAIDWDKDVVEHVSRAGGPGGQNVNKVSSAIRLEHLPTGITVSMRDEKSQHKNRAKARRILLSRIHDEQMRAQRSQRDAARRTMIGSGDRSQRIRTYNFPQNRCTDHRIGLDLYCLDRIMEGDIDPLIDALAAHDLQQRLAEL